MFQVTTLDLNDVPKTDEGKVDYAQDFFDHMIHRPYGVMQQR